MIDPLLLEFRLGTLCCSGFPKLREATLSSRKVRLDAVAQVAAGKFAKTGLGSEVILTGAGNGYKIHGSQGTEPTEPLAHGSLAQLQPDDQVIKSQRLATAVEKPVDLSHGPGKRENSKGPNKEIDGLALERGQGWMGRRQVRKG